MSEIFPHGKWLTTERFFPYEPIDIYRKGTKPKEVECPEELKHRHMLVKKTFTYHADGRPCRIRITADDYYKLYINGRFVCQGPAAGYPFRYYWNETAPDAFLQEGENEIFVDVYYSGFVNLAYTSADRRMGLIAELYQGDRLLLATDESWLYTEDDRYAFSHTMGYDTLVAENPDSRVKNAPYRPCQVKPCDHVFAPYPAKLLMHYEKTAVSTSPIPGGLLYDFGEEITATLRVKAKAQADGKRLRILFGEELEDSPLRIRYNMRCNCLAEEFWTMAEGEDTLEQYDYKAFRYLALLPEEGVTVEEVTALVRHYPFDDAYCDLQTDDAVLKSIWDICKNGVKYGAQEVFVDCPLREKGQYAGDLTITGASHVLLTGDLSLFRKAVDDQMASAQICPGLVGVTPGSQVHEIADYSLQFPILALRYYAYTGDKDYLAKCLTVCEGLIEHFKRFAGEDGLLYDVTDKWNLVDWPKNLRDGYDFDLHNPMPPHLGAHNVINAFYIGCVKQTEQIRALLGVDKPKESPALAEAFYRAFYRPSLGLFADSKTTDHCALQSNVIAAYYGLCRREDEKTIGDFLMKKGLCCGVYMAYFLLKALCRMERHQDAYALLTNQSEHSWYNMVREGATACMEAWGKDQKTNTSWCHPWASGPISLLAEDLLPRLPHLGRLVRRDPVAAEITPPRGI